MKYAIAIMIGLLTLACSTSSDAPEPDSSASADSSSAGGMEPMPGMASGTTRMIRDLRATIARLADAHVDSMAASLPDYRRNAANVLAEMNREMASMQMGSDPAWTATSDSVRLDLVRMAEADPEQLRVLVPEHGRRMERLMTSHEVMMKH